MQEQRLKQFKKELDSLKQSTLAQHERNKAQQFKMLAEKREVAEYINSNEKYRYEVIAGSEAVLEELRRRYRRAEQIIQEEALRGKALNQQEIERQCDQLFGQSAPILFIPRSGNKLE